MNYKKIIYKKADSIATVILNRPEAYNALDLDIRKELYEVVLEVESDKSIKVLIITGSGKAFCGGGDITTMRKMSVIDSRERLRFIQGIYFKLSTMEKVVIASVNGHAYGAGCNLALACDLIICSKDAKFCQPYMKVGLIPDVGAMYFLPRTIGMVKAKELIFTGRVVEADEAERMGLVNYVVSPQDLETKTMDLAQQISDGPTYAIGMAKTIINSSFESDLKTLLHREADAQAICFQTEDFIEGTSAFLEKRRPHFKGF